MKELLAQVFWLLYLYQLVLGKLSLDFIEGLPQSASFNCILVVADKFFKYAHFLPLSHPFTAFQIAVTYITQVYKLHGLPKARISDRDRVFTSQVWRELFKLLKVNLLMSSAYHHQTDGQTQRVNQCLETYLRCFVHACPKKWSQWLSFAEFCNNTSYHSSLGQTPFKVLYGHDPNQMGITLSDTCQNSDLQVWLQEKELIQQVVHQYLLHAQNKMKIAADQKRSFREFQLEI